MKNFKQWLILLVGFVFVTVPVLVSALDSDNDGLDDQVEVEIYKTDPQISDTDQDGYFDGQEVKSGFSPVKAKARLKDLDWDKDGLSDELEVSFGTDMKNPDSDGDGFKDGHEVEGGFSPTSTSKIKLTKKIEINLKGQKLSYWLGGIKLGEFLVSTGRKNSTPKGSFAIRNKSKLAWSRSAKLWMPYWMAYSANGRLGLHQLPYWPGGKREGEEDLGRPVSGGCVRLGIKEAKVIFNWAEVGTVVNIN